MKVRSIISVCIFLSLIAFVFINQLRQNKTFYKQNVNGKVISVEKKLKGYYEMTILQSEKLRYISFVPKEEKMAWAGDSVYKESNSEIFYLKKEEASTFSKVNWGDIHISRDWE